VIDPPWSVTAAFVSLFLWIFTMSLCCIIHAGLHSQNDFQLRPHCQILGGSTGKTCSCTLLTIHQQSSQGERSARALLFLQGMTVA
jgi:hypothetical protein